jgi:hypothetical protein
MRKAAAPPFRLRFRPSQIATLASRFPAAGDAEAESAGRTVRPRGWLTRSEFLRLCEWKTPRTRPRCASNSSFAIRRATEEALAAKDPSAAAEALTQLAGVGMPTASVILHFCARDPYPVLDVLALWSLGCDVPVSAYPRIWPSYVAYTRELARHAKCDMRTLDRALWQYAKERQ